MAFYGNFKNFRSDIYRNLYFKKDEINTKFTIVIEGTMSLISKQYSPSNYIVISFLRS